MLRFLVSLVASGLVVAGAWFGWTHPTDVMAGAGPADHPGSTRSCAVPGPTDAKGMNLLMGQLDREPTLAGADHGGSVALADGRRFHTFGDTIRDTEVATPFLVHNSVLVVDGGCIEALATDDDGAVIPDDAGQGYWPMSLRATPTQSGTTVQVITETVRVHGHDHQSFETSGSNLATFEVPTDGTPRLVSQAPLGPRTTDPSVATWGAAMWDEGGYTYLFGTASNATKSTAGWSLHVARTSPDDLADPDAWEYWDGDRWVAGQPSAAQAARAELIGSDHGVSHVLGVLERDGSWYAVSKEGDFHGEWLSVWKAPSVTGPYTKHRVRRLANDARIQRYMPLVHPDVDMASGRLLVSWSESPIAYDDFVNHPKLYRPHFDEIDLP